MNIRNTLYGLAALVASACATTQATPTTKAPPAEAQVEEKKERIVDGKKIPEWVPSYTPIEEVIRNAAAELESSAPGVKYGYGYIWSDSADTLSAETYLRRAAWWVYDGTAVVVPNNKSRCDASGVFSELQYPKIMKQVLCEADTDKDRFVSIDEAFTLWHRLSIGK